MNRMKLVEFTLLFLLSIFSLKSFGAQPIGYASVNKYDQNGTTGGSGGQVVTVKNSSELMFLIIIGKIQNLIVSAGV